MPINKNDVILHSSMGVELQEIHHGFKYKSKHKNKKGKWVYVYDDVAKGAKDLFDSNETVNNSISSKEKGYNQTIDTNFIYDHVGSTPVNFDNLKQLYRLKNKTNDSVSSKSYDKSRTQISNGKYSYDGKGNTTTKAKVTLRKKGTIHKTYDNVLKKLGF